MNLVNIIGQIVGDANIVYESENGDKKLYKFIIRVPKKYKNKQEFDLINIKAWSTVIEDEFSLHDQAVIGIEGKIHSYKKDDYQTYKNEIYANKILYLS